MIMKNSFMIRILIICLAFLVNQSVFCEHLNLNNEDSEEKLIKEIVSILNDYDSSEDDKKVLVTEPYSNEKLSSLIKKFPIIDEYCIQSEECAEKWMEAYNYLYEKINERSAFLEFQFESNITDENQKQLEDFAPIPNDFQQVTMNSAKEFLKNCKRWNAPLRRMLFLASIGIVSKNSNDTILLSNLSNKLETIFATAKVCDPDSNRCLSLEPDLSDIMKNSTDYDNLLSVWKGWHDATGPKMRNIFTKTVYLFNKQARNNGYEDLSERWLEDFETDNFEQVMDDLFEEIKPLYQQLHAYVRRKLNEKYASKYPSFHDPKLIPAHLLGNMWAQDWENIYDLVAPYPETKNIDLTKILIEKNYTPKDLFKQAEDFFVSIGLFPMNPTFWKYSLIEKPQDREVQCHASATDFCNGFDFRIKMCTEVNDEEFFTIHHEMGHIEYYMAYKDQPSIFKAGANSAFHEAIGDTIALSVMSPKHLKRVNLIDDDSMTYEQNINYLLKMALKKLAFLPFGYLMDKWRWNVFRGVINESNYNEKWWQMRKEYQGLEPPIPRSEKDFDPAAKYHIASYTPYARYFVSHFHQFQFYRALCKLAHHKGQLHECDFYKSINAGTELRNMLSLGASKHWTYALRSLTGEKNINAKSLFKYFKPLSEWLKNENNKFPNDEIGW